MENAADNAQSHVEVPYRDRIVFSKISVMTGTHPRDTLTHPPRIQPLVSSYRSFSFYFHHSDT